MNVAPATMSYFWRRTVPFFLIVYTIKALDRSNFSFATLQISWDLPGTFSTVGVFRSVSAASLSWKSVMGDLALINPHTLGVAGTTR